jgi:hypothetical protein
MPEVLWAILVGLGTGSVAGILVASLHEWLHIGPLRRRCWQAEITLAQLRADPEGAAMLARLAARRRRTDDACTFPLDTAGTLVYLHARVGSS